ncbi:MAG: hypothetical protein SH848_18850 [Saprospiraceae bacterium]|nr:hypothetical protein [Saprospiraceae bacterium]MDZ4705993.1 hypothetical protein [Saprospiraceae bacterium]
MFAKTLLLLFLIFFTKATTHAQETPTFPASWTGVWAGDLLIHNAKGIAQTVPMEVTIRPVPGSANYDWITVYNNDTLAGKRPYTLLIKDEAAGHYAIDENNNIVLDAYLLGGKLFNSFEVQGQLLVCTYEVQGENLVFEVIAGPAAPVSTTGGGEAGEEKIQEVHSFKVNVMQRAVLKKG